MKYLKVFFALPLAAAISASCGDAAFPPEYGIYQVYALAAQTEGTIIVPLPTGGATRAPGRLAFFRTALASPTARPDYANGQLPPVCFGFSFSAIDPPGVGAPDAGKLSFSGMNPIPLVNLSSSTMVLPEVPSPLDCNRVSPPGLDGPLYTCAPAPTIGLVPPQVPTPMIGDATEITFTAEGSDVIGPINVGPIPAPSILRPTPAFETVMKNFDPKAPVVAEWIPGTGDLAVIEIIAVLGDAVGTSAQILCLEPMASGRKEIPAAALALIPESTNPAQTLTIITSLLGVNVVREDSAGWGGYLAGVARGTSHLACRAIMNIPCSPP